MKSRVWYLILVGGISMAGFIAIKTGRDAVFFSYCGLKQLPLAYIFIAIASVPAAMMHLKAIVGVKKSLNRRLSRRRVCIPGLGAFCHS